MLTASRRICHVQDLPITRHRAEQRREPSLLRHVQLMRLPKVRHCYQDWILCASRKEKEAADVRVMRACGA